jgi:predicted nucleic acid-binding protein
MIQVDTNYLIALENPASDASSRFQAWLDAGERVGVCAIVWTEYLCGPLSPAKLRAADELFRWKEPFLSGDAVVAAKLFNGTARRRGSMGDCMIAAVALRCHARFATLNRDDFLPYESCGLQLL